MRTNQRHLFLHLVVGLRHLDLLIVESRHAQDLDAVTDGLTFARYNPSSRPPLWCLHFWIYRLFLVTQVPEDARTLVAIAKTLRVKAIISSDAYETLSRAPQHLLKCHFYFVQHGLYIDQRRLQVKRKPPVPDRLVRITLFSVGEYDKENYRKRGVVPARVIPTGTLRNSLHTLRLQQLASAPKLDFDICLVEKGIELHPDSELEMLRRESWQTFLQAFNQFCHKFNPRLTVALSNSTDPQGTLAYIRQFLTWEFSSTDPSDSFATYSAIDSSQLTIGHGSTVLCEALSRRKVCLSFDYTGTGFWDLPGSGVHQLTNPNNHELFERINYLLKLDWESYAHKLPPELHDLITEDPSSGVGIMNSTIKDDINRKPNNNS